MDVYAIAYVTTNIILSHISLWNTWYWLVCGGDPSPSVSVKRSLHPKFECGHSLVGGGATLLSVSAKRSLSIKMW